MTKSRIRLAACVDDPNIHTCDPTHLIFALHKIKHRYSKFNRYLQHADPDTSMKVLNITVALLIRALLRTGSKKMVFWIRCVLYYLKKNDLINGKILDTEVAEKVITLAFRRAYCKRI